MIYVSVKQLLLLWLMTHSSICDPVCNVKESEKFDCFPEPHSNRHDCLTRGCCWDAETNLDVPYCYYGNGNFGYQVEHVNETETGFVLVLLLHGPGGPYGDNVNKLKANFRLESDTRLHVKIYDAVNERYEVPILTPPAKGKFGANYQVTYTEFPFGFTVKRRRTGNVIFMTSVGGFIFSDQFIQISSLLPSHNIYGLGEHVLPFKLSTNWLKLTTFARDVATPQGGYNLYGAHPFYLNIEDDGLANGVFLMNSNAMDIILQPTPAITYRTVGGILDFYIFVGSTPSEVVAEYNEVIGRPTMPPYWSLGFHLCRWGYNKLATMKKVRQSMREHLIPQDTQWNDIDYMSRHKDFTIGDLRFHGLDQFVDELHKDGMHYMMILDPAIKTMKGYKPYDEGVREDIFIKDENGDILEGQVWPGKTAYPDFFNPNTSIYWFNQIKEFHEKIHFDGLWIDMNEPSNFVSGSTKGCRGNKYDNPPYLPNVIGGKLADKTICMNARQHIGRHYDLHSLYGHSEAVVTKNALDKIIAKRSLVVSRSTFSGSGQYAAHWSGDNHSTWTDLYYSISGILNFNLFGIPMVGSDICGFMGDTNEELCSRWMQLGAFYPFSRNHNSIDQKAQHPTAFGKQLITVSREALKVRYTLLPYLYTLFFEAHMHGYTVARPLFFEFTKDNATYSIDSQFLWGSSLLISPVLTQGATKVKAYLPRGSWYDYYTGEAVISSGEYVILPASFDQVNLHVREGYIIPIQDPALNTTASRKNDFGLIVALDGKGNAHGHVFLDDGESFIDEGIRSFVSFKCVQNELRSKLFKKNYTPGNTRMSHVRIFGVNHQPKEVIANGKVVTASYDEETKVLQVDNLMLSILEEFTLTWST